jgi:alkylation response protein AidB-like acyl-CoA dehydrogenase
MRGAKANIAKLLASEASGEALDVAVQVHGGHAFVAETDVATLWPMVRAMRTGPINNRASSTASASTSSGCRAASR